MLRITWQPGPADGTSAPVLISLTDFEVSRLRDMPAMWLTGLRLRRAWPRMEGAVGLWLWARPLERRAGSISVWESEQDLLAFVRWPVHVAIMRKYRERGSLRSTSWESERFVRSDVWSEAVRFLLEPAAAQPS